MVQLVTRTCLLLPSVRRTCKEAGLYINYVGLLHVKPQATPIVRAGNQRFSAI